MKRKLLKLWPLSRGRRRIARALNLGTNKIPFNSMVSTKPNNLLFNIHKDDVYFDVYYFNDYEKRETTTILSLLNENDIFFDIGANFGWFALNSIKKILPKGKVYCFEPQKTLCEEIKKNLQLNNFDSLINENLFITNKAVGATNSNLFLEINRFSHAQTGVSTLSTPNIEAELVEQITLDNFFIEQLSLDKKPKIIKCDVEGWELNVVKGSKNLCTGDDKPIWLLEVNKEASSRNNWTIIELIEILKAYGYDNFIFLSYAYRPYKIYDIHKIPSNGNILVFHTLIAEQIKSKVNIKF